jgi:energy-coupling factor transport system permease protein
VIRPMAAARTEATGPLGRTSPLVKAGLATAWIGGLALTTSVAAAAGLALVSTLATVVLGPVSPRRLGAAMLPLLSAAVGIGLANALFSGANGDPAAAELLRLGPLRLTEPAAAVGAGLGTRVLAIVAVGGAFSLTTDATCLVDALVQQAGVSPRFAYATLAAYQAVPRLGEDLGTILGARRLRGLRPAWHPRVLVGLLVRAIRHADQLAVALDARGLGTGPRTAYRDARLRRADAAAAIAGLAVLAVVLIAVG